MGASGNPSSTPSSRQVRPPSWVVKRPEPSPPLSKKSGLRRWDHMPANMCSGLRGSAAKSEQPVRASKNNWRCQDSPPSLVWYTPRCSPSDQVGPSTATQAESRSRGSSRIRWIFSDSSNPRCRQVLPPSKLRYIPVPTEDELRGLPSPVPIQITSGSVGQRAMLPIELDS